MTVQIQQIVISVEELLQALEPLFRGPGMPLYKSLQTFLKNKLQTKVELSFQFELEKAPELDALAEIATLAQPLGPSDLARNFDHYTQRTTFDEITSQTIC